MKESDNDYMNNKSPVISKGEPYIICAAIWFQDGKKYVHQPRNIDSGLVICGRRHHNCYLTAFELQGEEKTAKVQNVQGFITSDDRFLNRKEAGELAFKVGQTSTLKECLFSEDLY